MAEVVFTSFGRHLWK